MSEILQSLNIYLDEVDKIRIIDPEVSQKTIALKDECKIYVERIEEFRKLASKFISLTEKLGAEVENQKMKAIGTRNILQTMQKQQETNKRQLKALLAEKSMELERLKIELNSLQKIEMEQNETILQLMHY